MLYFTDPKKMLDDKGRPYFLWDVDMTLEQFIQKLRDSDKVTRAYLIGKLMRQSKPEDVFQFVTRQEIRNE